MSGASAANNTICRYFATTGSCYYGDQCNFSHAFRPTEHSGTNTLPKNQRPCRNIALHGYCKFAGKGCDYNHELSSKDDPNQRQENAASDLPDSPFKKVDKMSESLQGLSLRDIRGRDKEQEHPDFLSEDKKANNQEPRGQAFYGHSGSQWPEPLMYPSHNTVGFSAGGNNSGNHQPPIKGVSPSVLPYSFSQYNPYSESGRDYQSSQQYNRPFYENQFSEHHYDKYNNDKYNASFPGIPRNSGAADYSHSSSSEYFGKSLSPNYANMKPPTQPRGKEDPQRYAEPLLRDYPNRSATSSPYDVPPGGATDPSFYQLPASTPAGSYYYANSPQSQPFSPSLYGFYVLPHLSHQNSKRPLQSFFMSESFQKDLYKKKSSILARAEAEDPRSKDFPPIVGNYHSLNFLDDIANREKVSKIFGYVTVVMKGVGCNDGLVYCLRKIDSFYPSKDYYLSTIDTWKMVVHSNIVTLRDAFISKELGDHNSLIFVHDFHPNSCTLEAKYFSLGSTGIPEPVLWSYILQLTSALRTIHGASLACRILHPSKILLTGKNRIRINGAAILDVLNPYDSSKVLAYQQEDLIHLGKLVLSLACKTLTISMQNVSKLLDYVGTVYSAELKNFILFLLTKPSSSYHTINEVCSWLGVQATREIENLHYYTDILEAELSKEVENGRLFRLMVKLGFINERPEFGADLNWSETGDRYLLKLFRDYVFHQAYEDGSPVMDWGHILESLNKLDAGVNEKIVLMSRDEKSMLIVTYRDIKRCIDNAFNELCEKYQKHNSKYV